MRRLLAAIKAFWIDHVRNRMRAESYEDFRSRFHD